jgi:hypothetical protein
LRQQTAWKDEASMFEAAEAGRTISKADYEAEVAKLRWELLDAQRLLSATPATT